MAGVVELSSGGTVWRRVEPVFDEPDQLKTWCAITSRRLEEMGIDVSLSAVLVQKLLEKVPDGRMGFSARWRARIVVKCLHIAATQLDRASGQVAGTYVQFLKSFGASLEGK